MYNLLLCISIYIEHYIKNPFWDIFDKCLVLYISSKLFPAFLPYIQPIVSFVFIYIPHEEF